MECIFFPKFLWFLYQNSYSSSHRWSLTQRSNGGDETPSTPCCFFIHNRYTLSRAARFLTPFSLVACPLSRSVSLAYSPPKTDQRLGINLISPRALILLGLLRFSSPRSIALYLFIGRRFGNFLSPPQFDYQNDFYSSLFGWSQNVIEILLIG